MLTLAWHLSAAVHRYLTIYAPSNILIRYLRQTGGWRSVLTALATSAGYLYAMSLSVTILDHGGPGWLNVLVMLFAWNAFKFGVMGVVSVPKVLWLSVAVGRTSF